MADLKVVIDEVVALKEVQDYVAGKKILPSRRKALNGVIDLMAEAISYGLVVIGTDGSITQTLWEPIKTVDKKIALETLVYPPRVAPEVLIQQFKDAKATTHSEKILAAVVAHTGEPKGMLDKLESTDRDIMEAIGFFYLL